MPFNISENVIDEVGNRSFALPMGYLPIPIHSTNVTKDPVLNPFIFCTNFYTQIDS